MIQDYFDKIFVVGISRSADRRKSIIEQFKKLNITNYEIPEGVDGFKLDLYELIKNGILIPKCINGFNLTPGEVGCAMSHANVYKEVVEQYDKVLICEDDCIFHEDANKMVDDYMDQMPNDWDIIHFHSSHPIGSGLFEENKRIKITQNIWTGYKECGGCVCYAINKRSAEFLFNRTRSIAAAADGPTNILTAPWTKGYKGYVTHPFIVVDYFGNSLIGKRREEKLFL